MGKAEEVEAGENNKNGISNDAELMVPRSIFGNEIKQEGTKEIEKRGHQQLTPEQIGAGISVRCD